MLAITLADAEDVPLELPELAKESFCPNSFLPTLPYPNPASSLLPFAAYFEIVASIGKRQMTLLPKEVHT